MTEDEEVFEKKFMNDGYQVFRNGWPDFLIFKDGEAKFVEVKGYGDQLSNKQIGLLQILANIGLPCFIWNPEEGFVKFKDHLIKTNGKAKSETTKEMPIKIEKDIMWFMKRNKYGEVKRMAEKLSINRVYLSAILTGAVHPSVNLAKKLAKLTGKSIFDFRPDLKKLLKEIL